MKVINKDLGNEIENVEQSVENLKNKEFKLFGIKMTPMTITAGFAGIGSVVGMLYGGFVTYQKVESIAEIEPEAIFAQLEKVNTRLDVIEKNIDDSKSDIKRAEETADDAYRYVKDINKEINDELRSFRKDVKEIENAFGDKLQKALNNPLSEI